MTISSSELKKNMTLIIEDELYQVIEWQHRKPPKAPPTLTLKVKSLKNEDKWEFKIAEKYARKNKIIRIINEK